MDPVDILVMGRIAGMEGSISLMECIAILVWFVVTDTILKIR